MSDDFARLHAWRAGDATGGNALVREHFAALFRFFHAKAEEAAEDLAQQTLLALVEGRDDFHGSGTFRAYMFGIARRQLLMWMRTRYRARKVFTSVAVSMADVVGERASAGALAVKQSEQRMLVAAMRMIPVDFQIVLELHYWEGMSVAEIASVVEIATGTVKSRLSRARAMVQARLDRLAPGSFVIGSDPRGG